MLPDPGCYEERYRLTGRAALGLTASLLSIGLGILWHSPVISATAVILAIPVIFSALAVLFAMPGVIALGRRMIAFRADYAGITLGIVPDNLPALRNSAVFIPWTDVERIILYPDYPGGQGASARVQRIAVQRREGALSQGNEQAPGCPVTGVTTGATRRITGWRLDRERLAAVTAAVAPGIPIVDAGTGPTPGGEGPGQGAIAPELGPTD
jgi:hypothetical protein